MAQEWYKNGERMVPCLRPRWRPGKTEPIARNATASAGPAALSPPETPNTQNTLRLPFQSSPNQTPNIMTHKNLPTTEITPPSRLPSTTQKNHPHYQRSLIHKPPTQQTKLKPQKTQQKT